MREGFVKITCILGSPRKNGNSAAIAGRFLRTAESGGAETKTFVLNELNFRGCQACMACKEKLDRCVLQDDLTDVFESMRSADIIVAATPIYSGYVSGQFKCFMDRCYSLLSPDFITNPQPSRLPPGKKAVVVTTQGNPDPASFDASVRHLQMWAKRNWRADEVRVIKGCGLRADANPEPFLKEAENLARSLCG
jgi:multimeric flavodoxin WrbA